MKIALVNKTFSLSHGGAERFSVNLATAFCREGHDVHVFANRAEDLPDEVVVHTVPSPQKPAVRRVLSFPRQVRKLLITDEYDIVYGLTQIYPQDLHRMGGGIHRHWMRIRYPFAPWRWCNYLFNMTHLMNIYLEKQIYRPDNYRRIVTNSRLCAKHARQYYDVPPERIAVIYNGVDHHTFNPEKVGSHREDVRGGLGLEEKDLVFLFVASNWQRKGLDVLIRAVSTLGIKGKSCHVLVVGRGKPSPFVKLARQLGLENRVHFVGPTREIQRYYAAGDLMVLPTLYDPFANVCLEAMACGKPVITTSANGAAEIIRPGETGFVQKDPRSYIELALLLEKCLDREKRMAMGRRAREISLDFTLRKNLMETIDVCRQVQAEKNR
jgi:UDP-glucose:(heptosyl)LPS alpha-1,3-glucosyltransferase